MANRPLHSRNDVAELMRAVFEPLRARLTPTGAGVALIRTAEPDDSPEPSWRDTARIEAVLRPLWGPASLAAGGGTFDHWDRVREVISAGTDPDHPDYWGAPAAYDQRLVEMSTLGAGLLLAPHQIWEPFDRSERSRLVAWLRFSETTEHRDNNWWFFRVMVQLGLKRVGVDIDTDAERRALDRIDACYVDDGWYSDFPNRPRRPRVDWYGAHVFHTFGLLYAWSDLGEPRRAEAFRERARLFAPHLRHWFAPDGAGLPFGRSLTYRCAPAAFWPMLAAAGVDALPLSETKGLYLRTLRYWQPVLTEPKHLLAPGYGQPRPLMVERYITPGSPYWACLAFLSLMLPDEHPFWTVDEQPPVVPTRITLQETPGFALSSDGDQVLALSNRQTAIHASESTAAYSRFAYSSLFGFTLDSTDSSGSLISDSTLTISSDDGRHAVRSHPIKANAVNDVLMSSWRPWSGVRVHTALQGAAPWHWRVHLIETRKPLVVRDWGFSVEAEEAVVEIDDAQPISIALETPDQRSGLVCLDRSVPGICSARPAPSGTSLLVDAPLTPCVERHLAPGTHWLVVMVFGGGVGRTEAWFDRPEPDWVALDRLLHRQRRRVTMESVWRPPLAVDGLKTLVRALRRAVHD